MQLEAEVGEVGEGKLGGGMEMKWRKR